MGLVAGGFLRPMVAHLAVHQVYQGFLVVLQHVNHGIFAIQIAAQMVHHLPCQVAPQFRVFIIAHILHEATHDVIFRVFFFRQGKASFQQIALPLIVQMLNKNFQRHGLQANRRQIERKRFPGRDHFTGRHHDNARNVDGKFLIQARGFFHHIQRINLFR